MFWRLKPWQRRKPWISSRRSRPASADKKRTARFARCLLRWRKTALMYQDFARIADVIAAGKISDVLG